MSSKDLVVELMQRLPDEVSLVDIAREIEFVAGIREALSDFDSGQSITAEQILREIPHWSGNTK